MISYETPAEQEKGLVQALDLLQSEEYSNDEIIVLSALAYGPAAGSSHPGLRGRLAPYGMHTSKIGYTTIHSYKGLDAPAVVVTDIDQATGERAEALLYVALSRAADRLVVLAHREAMREMAGNLLKGYGASA
jgi:superfamily I DNA/RNA helicase